jgi:hypothetical protein
MAGKSADLIQRVVTRVRVFVKGRHRILTRGDRFDARLPFVVTLLDAERGFRTRLQDAPALLGFTRNLSETGMTLLLPSVRIGDAYVTDIERRLEVKLELPEGPVALHTTPVRFEQLPRREAGCGYLLAVRITGAQGDGHERFVAYLKRAGNKEDSAPERRKGVAAGGGSNAATPQAGKWEALTPASVSKAFEKFVRE